MSDRWDVSDTLIDPLLAQHGIEGVTMPKTLEEFRQYYLRAHMHELPPEELLKGVPLEVRLKGLSTEQILKGIAAEIVRRGLSAEEVLMGLSGKHIERLRSHLKRLEENPTPTQENVGE